MPKAFISGCVGLEVSQEEIKFFKENQPWGFIVFARNIDTPEQLTDLIASLRECVDHPDVPVMIDQEGGRVQRMKQPHWRKYPATGFIGQIEKVDHAKGLRAAWLHGRLLASDLYPVGINVNCAPVLDVPVEGSNTATLGDRTFCDSPEIIAELGGALCQGMLDGGVAPIIKHMPGLGRATVDSHYDLPEVDCDLATLSSSDFLPFKTLNDQAMAMTAHIVYSQIDAKFPATQSEIVVGDIIRKKIGFDGLLMSDDVSMNALKGDFSERSKRSFDAGCDMILHCNGEMDEMRAVGSVCPNLCGKSLERATKAMEAVGNVDDSDISSLHSEYDELLSLVSWPPVG